MKKLVLIIFFFNYVSFLNSQLLPGEKNIKRADSFFKIAILKYLNYDSIQVKKAIDLYRINIMQDVQKLKLNKSKRKYINNRMAEMFKLYKNSSQSLNGLKLLDYAILGEGREGSEAFPNMAGCDLYRVCLKLKNKNEQIIYSNAFFISACKNQFLEVFWGNNENETEDNKVQFQDSKEHYLDYFK